MGFEKSFPIQTKELKEGFARSLLELLPPGFTFRNLEYSFRVFAGYTARESLSFAYPETVSAYSLWEIAEFLQLNPELQAIMMTDLVTRVRGWRVRSTAKTAQGFFIRCSGPAGWCEETVPAGGCRAISILPGRSTAPHLTGSVKSCEDRPQRASSIL